MNINANLSYLYRLRKCVQFMEDSGASLDEALDACIVDNLGPDNSLSSVFEQSFAQFVNDAEQIDLPRCSKIAATDIFNHLQQRDVTITAFKENKPGLLKG